MSTKAIAIAALFSVMLPAAAMAQDAGQPAGGAPAAEAGAAGQQGSFQDFESFLESFGAADFTAAAGSLAADGTSTFTVVSIGELANADPARLQEAVQAKPEELAALRAAVAANEEAVAYLEDEGLTPEHVVWAERGTDGTVTLYVTNADSV